MKVNILAYSLLKTEEAFSLSKYTDMMTFIIDKLRGTLQTRYVAVNIRTVTVARDVMSRDLASRDVTARDLESREDTARNLRARAFLRCRIRVTVTHAEPTMGKIGRVMFIDTNITSIRMCLGFCVS